MDRLSAPLPVVIPYRNTPDSTLYAFPADICYFPQRARLLLRQVRAPKLASKKLDHVFCPCWRGPLPCNLRSSRRMATDYTEVTQESRDCAFRLQGWAVVAGCTQVSFGGSKYNSAGVV